MIVGYEKIRERIGTFTWEGSGAPFESRCEALLAAVDDALIEACSEFSGPVHMACSGGVDSTLLMYRAAALSYPVVAHVMCVDPGHADFQHCSRAVSRAPGHEVYLRPHFVERQAVDAYHVLMGLIGRETGRVVCGDCIDELQGGYYSHQDGGRPEFQSRLERLIPEHLQHLERESTAADVLVHLPFASPGVMAACSAFLPEELVRQGDVSARKLSLMAVARMAGVDEENLIRRKLGLVSWQNAAPKSPT